MAKRLLTFIKNSSSVEKILYSAILFFLFIALLLGVERISSQFSTVVPTQGGTFTEGIVGFPESISPIYAESNAEHDLTALIYSGLMRVDGDGDIVTDLAESYEISEDGNSYTFTIRDDAVFHDGTPITASDVVFTIEEIKNPASESPLRSTFLDVEVSALDASTVEFSLEEPYAGFLEQTTVGIVPRHIWENVTQDSLEFIEHSSSPIGSGPFKIKNVERSTDVGVPTNYTLTAFDDYTQGRPYLNNIEIRFFSNEAELLEALDKGRIDSAALVSPRSLENQNLARKRILTAPMLRSFGLFFNQAESEILSEDAVRKAIDMTINRENLAESIFSGYALPIETPLPFGTDVAVSQSDEVNSDPNALLEEEGWIKNPLTGIREKDEEELSFSIATADSDMFGEVANFIKHSLEQVGFSVTIETFDIAVLNQDVIRPREYEALLFGEAYDRVIDMYPFWHSSERDDPGLNVARYTSSDVDERLEDLRSERDERERRELLNAIVKELREDVPAVFLYSPEFIYIQDKRIKNISIPPIVRSANRFANVHEWFVYTDTVWNAFLD
ncbi:MAG: peptide ABC transporter substrate-binding protein [Candidatus Campbellbacteria bacterium]|nr:peptide ABC transporter substrate-binding protein [Candidatus Campbellbacteria bacterium]